jgi:hypothetical protein
LKKKKRSRKRTQKEIVADKSGNGLTPASNTNWALDKKLIQRRASGIARLQIGGLRRCHKTVSDQIKQLNALL